MGFSSDTAGEANQLIANINVPSIGEGELFDNVLKSVLGKYASSINSKTGGLLSLSEKINFKQVYTVDNPQRFRNVYRKCFDLIDLNGGNIASGATVAFAHGISPLSDAIQIYVSCVSTNPEYFTCVYPDIYLDSVNINFTNPHPKAVTSAIAICEYTKN